MEIAQTCRIGDLVIGLTIVGIGASMPQFSSTLAGLRHEAYGDLLGHAVGLKCASRALVGVADALAPFTAPREVLSRDPNALAAQTRAPEIDCRRVGRADRINRVDGGVRPAALAHYSGQLWVGIGADAPATAATAATAA